MERERVLLSRREIFPASDEEVPRTPRSPLRFGIPVLDEEVPWIPAGSVFLLVGPPLPEKEALVYNILREGLRQGDGAILVSTGARGEECLGWFRAHDIGLEPVQNRVGIVDCATLRGDFPEDGAGPIRRVSSPLNFTGITRAVGDFMGDFRRRWGVRRCRFAIHTLSTLLLQSDLRAAFRFIHAFNNHVRATRGVALYGMQQGLHDDGRVLPAMEALADGVIEVRTEHGLHLLRMRRGSGGTGWLRFEVRGGRIHATAGPAPFDLPGAGSGGETSLFAGPRDGTRCKSDGNRPSDANGRVSDTRNRRNP